MKKKAEKNISFTKVSTGIEGLDEITEGGFPRNRTTLIVGGAGCGKTIMAMEFLEKGAVLFNEPGVFMAFEEKTEELETNVASLGYNLKALIAKKKIYLEHIEVDRTEILETGEFDMEGLFVRLDTAINSIGAKRVVLDSLDALFYGLKYQVLRGELKRLFNWLKKKGVTVIITAESGENSLTRQGLEEYVVDCVVALDNRVVNQISTRRLRIVKYRGSVHGNNEYPFTINNQGVSVFPIIAKILDSKLSAERISSGIKGLDEMLSEKGYYQGASILVSGSAGTGKTSIAMSLVNALCKKKERCLYCAFEESPQQIIRNMGSIGLHLEPFIKSKYLQFYFYRPTLQNLELHLIKIQKIVEEYKPGIVVLDPVTNIMSENINSEIRYMLTKFVDFLKDKQITILFTAAITLETIKKNPSDEGISSMVDTWLLMRDIEKNSERNRGIYVLKSRGMKHSNQIREFKITDEGIELLPVFIGNGEVLTGSAKKEFELKEKTKQILSENEIRRNKREIEGKIKIMEAEAASLKAQFEATTDELKNTQDVERIAQKRNEQDTKELMHIRIPNNKKSKPNKR